MTEEERKLMISYLEDMKEEYVEGEGNEKYPLPEWYMLDRVIKIIEQQPNENEEIIKVSKGAVKARTGRFVVYDAKWLKEHFSTTEAKIYGQPNEDWNAVLDELNRIGRNAFKDDTDYDNLFDFISNLPNVKPQSKTDILDKIEAEIDEASTYDGIYIDRAYVFEIIDKYKENEGEG